MRAFNSCILAVAAVFMLARIADAASSTISAFTSGGQICYVIRIPKTSTSETSDITSTTLNTSDLPITSPSTTTSTETTTSDATTSDTTNSEPTSTTDAATTTTPASIETTTTTTSEETTSTTIEEPPSSTTTGTEQPTTTTTASTTEEQSSTTTTEEPTPTTMTTTEEPTTTTTTEVIATSDETSTTTEGITTTTEATTATETTTTTSELSTTSSTTTTTSDEPTTTTTTTEEPTTTTTTTTEEPTTTSSTTTEETTTTTTSTTEQPTSTTPPCVTIPITTDFVVNGNFDTGRVSSSIDPPWVTDGSTSSSFPVAPHLAHSGSSYWSGTVTLPKPSTSVYQDMVLVGDSLADYNIDFYLRPPLLNRGTPIGTPGTRDCRFTAKWGSNVVYSVVLDENSGNQPRFSRISVIAKPYTSEPRLTFSYTCDPWYIGISGQARAFVDTVSIKPVVPLQICE